MQNDQNNPLFPIEINDYPKLFDYVVTATGLVYFQTLKRNYILGKSMSLDEYNKLRLLHVYYAAGNKNPKEIQQWQDMCLQLEEKGIFEKNMYQSKEDLKEKSLITKNPDYQSGLYRIHVDYIKNKIKSK
ncbi:MAG: hypothetical protein K5790_02595 [Nitrosopumilus sp.]|uniref:hypothetical protein n=1 Tax=Nitrosopumilus sp. TaxID=2024843 RepID=UPI00247E18FB|nr:hypothetical protein [Nitrosopumilus sp.]MCV0392165.1 hypothetical protein [Nitrosopumilus sp.]